jgi:hypothetical protein
LEDIGDIYPTTPAGMNPLTGINLGTTINILLNSLSNDLIHLGYVVREGIITIGTADNLSNNLETYLYDISPVDDLNRDMNELIHSIEVTIDLDTWYHITAEKKPELEKASGDEFSSRLNSELSVLKIDLTEKEAQLGQIQKQIGENEEPGMEI